MRYRRLRPAGFEHTENVHLSSLVGVIFLKFRDYPYCPEADWSVAKFELYWGRRQRSKIVTQLIICPFAQSMLISFYV